MAVGPSHPTRGRTASGRLRLLDTFLRCRPLPGLRDVSSSGMHRVAVDLGFGASAVTSLELLRTLREQGASPDRLIAVEQAPERVAAARREGLHEPALHVREGGFQLPLKPDERVFLVRAMNVLRGYPLALAEEAHRTLGAQLEEGTWVLEGSADPGGHLLTCHLLRARGGRLERAGLLFASDFTRGFGPWQLRDWLPRDLRRGVRPGHPLHAFFETWNGAFERARAEGVTGADARFVEAARHLGEGIAGIDGDPALLARGLLVWSPPGGVPT